MVQPYTLPGLPQIGTRARKPASRQYLTPEAEESLARKAGRTALGGIAAVGNLLGLPGSMVLDTLSGKNPFDQLLTPTSPDNRTYGRQFLREQGIIGQQNTVGNFLGGLAVDIATDPLTYIFPFGALTKGGQAAKAAGLSSRTMSTAATKLGRPIAEIGKREAAINTTLGDLLKEAGPEAAAKVEQFAAKRGWKVADIANEPLRGMFATGVLGKVKHVAPVGKKSMAAAKAMDFVGEKLRYGTVPGTSFQPVNQLARLFSSPLADTTTKTGQVFARQGFEAKQGARAAANMETAEYIGELRRIGWVDDKEADLLRNLFEGTTPVAGQTPRVQQLVSRIQKRQESLWDEMAEYGVAPKKWVSPHAKHFPRHSTDMIDQVSGTGRRGYSAYDPHREGRLAFLQPWKDADDVVHAIKGETQTIKEILKDPQLNGMIRGGSTVREIAQKIRETYGNVLPATFHGKNGANSNRYLAFANWMSKRLSKEQRAIGLFGNHPILDMHSQLLFAKQSVAASKNIIEMLASPKILKPSSTAAHVAGTVTVKKLLRDASITGHGNQTAFVHKLSQRLGTDLTNLDPDDVADAVKGILSMRVDRSLADDVARFASGFKSPEPVSKIVAAIDSVTNLWKGHQTAIWPAFHTRNLVSGQYQNWIAGMWSGDSLKATKDLLRGKTVKGAASIPAVRLVAEQRGITQLTDPAATEILGELAYANGLTHRYAGEAVSRVQGSGAMAPAGIEDLLKEIPRPGVNYIDPKRIGTKFIGRQRGTNLKPWHVRGFGSRMESAFGPMAAGEELSGVVEGFNRIAPFIHQLKQGVSPQAAAQKVGAAQVMYQSRYYTPFESQVMKRIFPFYSFTSRVMPWTLRELAERPGGRLAQTIRAANTARNPSAMTPDYVSETTAIPLGSTKDGFDRYITGAGLMFEDPLSFAGSGVRGGLLEAGSRLNPLLKAPAEWMTGQSFFQKGPMGGRSLEDLDPTVGRMLANVVGRKKAVKLPDPLEFALSNSPASRALSTIRTMTYPIRTLHDPALRSQTLGEVGRTATNLLTGVRITSVSPGAKDAMLRERTRPMLKKLGGKTFIKDYIPKEVFDSLNAEEQAEADKLEALMHVLSMRAKERAIQRAQQ